eukprot:gene14392-15891_t
MSVKPEPESKSSPKPESTPEPEQKNPSSLIPEPYGEPLPEWETAIDTWGPGWPTHWIGCAVLFSLLLIISIILLGRLYKRNRQRNATTKRFSVTVTVLIIIFLWSRSFYLIINPYECPNACLFGTGNCPLFLSRLLFSIGIPSLVSAFLFVHLALLDVMKLRQLNAFQKLQNWRFLIGVVSLNYVFSCVADLVVAYKASPPLFIVLCQVYFILFSTGLVAGFSYTGISIYRQNKRNKTIVYKLSTRNSTTGWPTKKEKKRQNRKSIKKVLKLTFATTLLGLCFLVSQLYSLISVYTHSVTALTNPEPWAWLICQYFYRFIELLMAACLLVNISYIPKQKPYDITTKERNTNSKDASKSVRSARNEIHIS